MFRDITGAGEPIAVKAGKRWWLSSALSRTVPGDVSLLFRVPHLFVLGQIPFVRKLVLSTDRSRRIEDLKLELSAEFEQWLGSGPFLCGNPAPSLADLSAYPQIVTPELALGKGYFLPGLRVKQWVAAMEEAVPALPQFLPDSIRRN